jgi:hypothetical protein
MFYTEDSGLFWRCHSLGCGYSGEFKKTKIFIEDPVTYECPYCTSKYQLPKELNGKKLTFWGKSVDMCCRFKDKELIDEIEKRGYKVEKN